MRNAECGMILASRVFHTLLVRRFDVRHFNLRDGMVGPIANGITANYLYLNRAAHFVFLGKIAQGILIVRQRPNKLHQSLTLWP